MFTDYPSITSALDAVRAGCQACTSAWPDQAVVHHHIMNNQSCICVTVPTVDWVLLGSGECNKGQEFGSRYLLHVCRRT